MPIIASVALPYPTVNAVMNVARARVGDMLDSVDGTLLTNDAPYTQTYLDSAWTWYQNECNNAGVELATRTAFLLGIPPRNSDDPAMECFLSWAGCSDGFNEYDTPALPVDLVRPLTIWRRPSGATSNFQRMTQASNGLPEYLDTNRHDWISNAIYFFGETYAQDFKIRYSTYWGRLMADTPDMIVPMVGCENALGGRVAFEYVAARGGVAAEGLGGRSKEDFSQTSQGTSRRKQRQSIRRIGYSGNGSNRCWPVIRN